LKGKIETKTFLGIEGGGTRTIAVLADGAGKEVARAEAGPANLTLLDQSSLVKLLRSFAQRLPAPNALAIGLAGAWTDNDRKRVRDAAARVWPGVPCYATSDLETALTAAGCDPQQNFKAQVLIVSGTGSCCYGQSKSGRGVKVGGWGHVLGDKGSGYEIGLRGLKACVYYYDRDRRWPALGSALLRALQLNEPYNLIAWAQQASKAEIAGLAVQVFAAWDKGDKIARDILAAAAASLARDATTCAKQLGAKGRRARFILAGSSLLKQPRFAKLVGKELKNLWRSAAITQLPREGVWGAVELAAKNLRSSNSPKSKVQSPESGRRFGDLAVRGPVVRGPVVSSRMSPTEERNPRSTNLDRMPLANAIKLMLDEDSHIPAQLLREAGRIEEVIHAITKAFKRGGRLFYVGAGTSGRLGVLDASECPPTFRTPPEMVQAIIAGGEPALRQAIEGAEDDAAAGASAISFRNISSRDVVIGIAASGTTPFVWGALTEAKRRRAFTVSLCFNPYLQIRRDVRPNIVIAPNLGPELLTGSTRLKAGTATKLLLNIFTTLSMVRTGKVLGNLMVDLYPANVKLRDRATRIVEDLTGRDYDAARKTLERTGWIIKKAVARLGRK
jgi:N-acetylmuramic acid 6-phosphate etherase